MTPAAVHTGRQCRPAMALLRRFHREIRLLFRGVKLGVLYIVFWAVVAVLSSLNRIVAPKQVAPY